MRKVPLRAPVQAPSALSTWEAELWRLSRLYSESKDWRVEVDEGSGDRELRLTFCCSDPDWEAVNWAPEGLCFEVRVPASYPAGALPVLSVLGPEHLPSRFRELLPILFAESVTSSPPSSPMIYRALQHIDRHAVALWRRLRSAELLAEEQRAAAERAAFEAAVAEKAASERRAADEREAERAAVREQEAAHAASSWTPHEQELLEAALVEFRNETDTKGRWKLIAAKVSRTPRECAARFQWCRSVALGKVPPKPQVANVEMSEATDSRSSARPVSQTCISASEVKRQGVQAQLLDVLIEGFSSALTPKVVQLQVVCGRCKKPADVEVESRSLDSCETTWPCSVCKLELGVVLAPNICHAGDLTVAYVLGSGCHPTQWLRGDFEAVCGECGEAARVRNVMPGYRKRSNCGACHTALNLVVGGAQLLGPGVAQWSRVAEVEGERLAARRQMQAARAIERETLGVRLNEALPNKGTCKHMSKSFRWFRFPCCGRAFPCPTCHDDAMDHPHEWAKRMICGRCSHEQLFTNDDCRHCGAAQTRSKSSFWEGGQGNRNVATMSKKDSHKYRGLSKANK